MSAKNNAIERAIAAIVALPVASMSDKLGPILGTVFDAGALEYGAALQRAMNAMAMPGLIAPAGQVVPTPPAEIGAAGKNGRAPHGAVRAAVTAYFATIPGGATMASIAHGAATIDPRISAAGVTNELNRNAGKRYVNTHGMWSPIKGLRDVTES